MEDEVHGDVVGFGKGVRNDLAGETDADFERIGADVREHPVVEPAAASETAALKIECESGADERVDVGDRHFVGPVGRFEDAEAAGLEFFAGMKGQVVAADFWENPGGGWVLRGDF